MWQNWLLNIPAFMRAHRDAPICPDSACPRSRARVSIKRVRPDCPRGAQRARRRAPVVIGNSMGASSAAKLTFRFRRGSKLVLVSAAGLSTSTCAEPLLAGASVVRVTARRGARGQRVVKRPRLRRAGLQRVVRYPERLSPAADQGARRGAGTAGLRPRARGDDLLQRPRPAREDRGATLMVWGRNDLLVPRGDARDYVRLIGDNPAARFRGHGPPLDGRAPLALQPAGRGVHRRFSRDRDRRRGRQRLRAPRRSGQNSAQSWSLATGSARWAGRPDTQLGMTNAAVAVPSGRKSIRLAA